MHLSKRSMTILLIILGLLILWALGSWLFVAWIEEPAYETVEKRDGYEIREYGAYVVAETRVSSTGYDEASRDGFMLVADYIFGNNTTKEKIAMTKPVATQAQEESDATKIAMTKPVVTTQEESGTYTIGFIMPSTYTLENLPTPNNEQVTLREVPAQRVAARSFSGWYATDARSARAQTQLLAALERDGIVPLSAPIIAQYNPPLTMPLVLRNEVLIDIQ